MARLVVLLTALLFIAGLGFLTFTAIVSQGLTVASVLSILIVVMLLIGIVGALRNPPRG